MVSRLDAARSTTGRPWTRRRAGATMATEDDEPHAFRSQTLAHDKWSARPHRTGHRARTAGSRSRHRALRLSRPVPRPIVPRRAGGRVDPAADRDPRRHPAALLAGPPAHHDRASHGGTRAGGPARPAIRQDCRPGSRLVRRRTHRRRDAVRHRWRRAVADLLRPVPAAGVDRCLRAAGDLRLHGILGRAGGFGDARRRAVHPGGTGSCARAHRSGIARAPARVQGVRRGIPRCDAGPADAEGVRPERRVRADAGRQGARAVGQHVPGVGHQHPDTWHHRPWLCVRRGGGAGAGRVSRPPRRDEHRGAADRADGRHRDLPAIARPAHRAAPGPDRPGGCGRHQRAAGHADHRAGCPHRQSFPDQARERAYSAPLPRSGGRVGEGASAFHPASRSNPSASPILAAGAARIAT